MFDNIFFNTKFDSGVWVPVPVGFGADTGMSAVGTFYHC